jgi:hypothetical protein
MQDKGCTIDYLRGGQLYFRVHLQDDPSDYNTNTSADLEVAYGEVAYVAEIGRRGKRSIYCLSGIAVSLCNCV